MTNGTTAIQVTTKDEKPSPAQLWQGTEMKAYFSSGTVVNKERLYLITNTLKPIPLASLTCADLKTGEQLRKKTGVGYFHAGPIRLGVGSLLILNDGGTLTLVADDPKEYRELCRAEVCEGTLTAPALADGKLFVRDGKGISCISLAD